MAGAGFCCRHTGVPTWSWLMTLPLHSDVGTTDIERIARALEQCLA
jgi:hypothetical protein